MSDSSLAVSVGDNCIDFYLPPIDRRYVGGNAVNVAIALQQGGVPAAYVGVVGDDPDGELTLRKLSEQQIDVSHVKVLPGRTATTHIQLTHTNERRFVYEYLGPQPVLELDPATVEFICQHRLIHTTMAGGVEAYLPTFRKPPSSLISFDYGERSHPDLIARTLPLVDWAFFSTMIHDRFEAEALARVIFSRGPSLVVVTFGLGGSVAFDGEIYYQPAFPVDVVDTLGAGDAYIGTFIACRLKGLNVPTCMEKASFFAAQRCRHYGGWEQVENSRVGDLPEDR